MRETRPYGSVRGAVSDGRPYRDSFDWLRQQYHGAARRLFFALTAEGFGRAYHHQDPSLLGIQGSCQRPAELA
jgi:hypothetical protein